MGACVIEDCDCVGASRQALPLLRRIANQPLVYDEDTNELHRPSCLRTIGTFIALARGKAIELDRAPPISSACQPQATLALT